MIPLTPFIQAKVVLMDMKKNKKCSCSVSFLKVPSISNSLLLSIHSIRWLASELETSVAHCILTKRKEARSTSTSTFFWIIA